MGDDRKKEPKFSDSFDFTSKEYSIGLNASLYPFNFRNGFEVEKQNIELQELEEKYKNLVSEKDNKIYENKMRIKSNEEENLILKNKLLLSKEKLFLQRDFILSILNSKEISPRDIDYEISKYITLINDYQEEQFECFYNNFSWIGDFYMKMYDVSRSDVSRYFRYSYEF